MSDLATTRVLTPSTLEELVAALAPATSRTRLVAGGTDLVRTLRRPDVETDLLVDLTSVVELGRVRLVDNRLRVGALTTFARLQTDPLVRDHAPCLGLAATQVGSAQIRNAGTIGGNVANASPCADGVTALAALDAEVTTIDGSGVTRTRPLAGVLLGPGQTSLACDEAITEFSFAALGVEHRSAYRKIGSRTAVSTARLSVALVVRFDAAAGTLDDVRVALGAVGGIAFRVPALERALAGRSVDDQTAHLFAQGCVSAVRGSIPDRPSLSYKQRAAVGLAYDAWNMLALGTPSEPTLA